MVPLYVARIEDLGRGDLVKVDCAACHHVALRTPDAHHLVVTRQARDVCQRRA